VTTNNAYDANGNTLTKTDSTGTTTYSWDYDNRLTSVTLPGSGGTVSYRNDPFGRRIKKVSSSGTSIYAYDGDNLVEEANASGTAVARYSQGLNVDEPLAMQRGGSTSYYETDGIGSVTGLTNAAGALAQTYTFDSFGNTTASSGSLTNPFQYASREFDSEAMLYFMRARYFDPATGRFLSEDPLRFGAKAVDFYQYAYNSPTNATDPFGLQTTTAPPPPVTAPGPSAPAPPSAPIPEPPPVTLPTPTPQPGFPWGGFLRGAILEAIRELAFPPATARDEDMLKKNPCPQNAGRWTCTASCNLQGIGNNPVPFPRVTGTGTGSSQDEACTNAKRAATQSAPRGTYARHCQCDCSK
jgi:RHS repeat-associated protein